MQENVSIVITTIFFVLVIVMFPLYNFFERQDNMSYNTVVKETTLFIDEILLSGNISSERYYKYIKAMEKTGNKFNVELEAHRKIYTKDPENPAQNNQFIEQYEIYYTNDIFKIMETNNFYKLYTSDKIYIKVKNSNMTASTVVFNSIIGNAGKEKISFNYGGIVKKEVKINNGLIQGNTVTGDISEGNYKFNVSYTPNGIITKDSNITSRVSVTSNLPIGKIEYQWTNSYGNIEASKWTTFSNNEILTNTVNPGTYILYVKVTNMYGEAEIHTSNPFVVEKKDVTAPKIVISPDGSTIKQRTASATVNVTDDISGIKSAKYFWSTSTTLPMTTADWKDLSNGQTVSVSTNGIWYLWVKAEDNEGNSTTIRSNAFNIETRNCGQEASVYASSAASSAVASEKSKVYNSVYNSCKSSGGSMTGEICGKIMEACVAANNGDLSKCAGACNISIGPSDSDCRSAGTSAANSRDYSSLYNSVYNSAYNSKYNSCMDGK